MTAFKMTVINTAIFNDKIADIKMADFDEIIGNKGFNKDRRETMLKF